MKEIPDFATNELLFLCSANLLYSPRTIELIPYLLRSVLAPGDPTRYSFLDIIVAV